MRAVGRLFAAMLGFLAAVIGAAAFLLAAKLGLEGPPPGEEVWFWSRWVIYGGMAASMLGAMAFVPGAVLIVVTEIFSIRSPVVHVGAGGLLGLAATLTGSSASTASPTLDQEGLLMIAAGFVGGFVYWLIAGRSAGLKPLVQPGRDVGDLSRGP
jgi:hypothetical protein